MTEKRERSAPLPDAEGGNFIKVSKESNVRSVAGKIAHSCREGDPPAVLCIGPACINIAVKAVCTARGYLKNDGLDISFQPAFRDTDRSRSTLALYLNKTPRAENAQSTTSEPGTIDMSVGKESKPATVAGALAARIREGKKVSLVSIGVEAVANSVLAVGNARIYLEGDKQDVRAHPVFVLVDKEDRRLNALKLVLTTEQLTDSEIPATEEVA